jgi:hypothetical protein
MAQAENMHNAIRDSLADARPNEPAKRAFNANRRAFIGGSDARIIMGEDEKALLRLWQEKCGEVEPEDLSGNLIVQLGSRESAPQSRSSRSIYLRFCTLRRRKRRPSPPPFSGKNSIPAASRACCIAWTADSETCRRSFSKSTTVDKPN